jgi:hypothetical protein
VSLQSGSSSLQCELLREELIFVLVSETLLNQEVILKDPQEKFEDMSDERDRDHLVDDAFGKRPDSIYPWAANSE